jgi:DNA-binding LacI/PurR family transcriptional regulator
MLNSTIRQIAVRIEHDLRRRGLRVGDLYLTAEEVGRELSVQPHAASRAMRLLAKRGVLMRKRGAGTFVGPKGCAASDAAVQCIHILYAYAPDCRHVGMPTGDLIDGILESTGSINVQLNLLPAAKQVGYVQELIARGQGDGTLSGCVLIGCVREIQEAVLASGVSAVVFGGTYSSTSRLPSIDLDQTALGYLLGKHLLRQERRRIALITGEVWLPGDGLCHDGICRALCEAQDDHGGVMIRAVPPTGVSMATDVIVELLTQAERPSGLICRDPVLAEAAKRAAEVVGLRVPNDLEIVFGHWAMRSDLGLPHVSPVLNFKGQAKLVGQMLRGLVSGQRPDPEQVVIPVRLVARESDADGESVRVDASESAVPAPTRRVARRKRAISGKQKV